MLKLAIVLVVALLIVFQGLAAIAQSVTLPVIEKKDPKVPGIGYQARALVLLQSNKDEEALQAAQLALKKAEEGGNKEIIASANALLGKAYRRLNLADESLESYQKALDYWKTQPKSEYLIGLILNNMGEEYKAAGRPDKACPTLEKAASDIEVARERLRQSKMNANLPGCCVVYENLAQVQFQQGKLAESEKNLKKAIEFADQEGDKRSQVDSRMGMIMVLSRQNRIAEAKQVAHQAIERIKAISGPNDPRIVMLSQVESGSVVLK